MQNQSAKQNMHSILVAKALNVQKYPCVMQENVHNSVSKVKNEYMSAKIHITQNQIAIKRNTAKSLRSDAPPFIKKTSA